VIAVTSRGEPTRFRGDEQAPREAAITFTLEL
jgi:hypothetical protein